MSNNLNPQIIAAAIEGFENQKKRLDAQIRELRAMLNGGRSQSAAAEPPKRKRRRISTSRRKGIAEAQRKRWAETKQQSALALKNSHIGSPEAQTETQRRGEKENHRSHEAALGIETGRIGAGAKGLVKEGRHRESHRKKSSVGSDKSFQRGSNERLSLLRSGAGPRRVLKHPSWGRAAHGFATYLGSGDMLIILWPRGTLSGNQYQLEWACSL